MYTVDWMVKKKCIDNRFPIYPYYSVDHTLTFKNHIPFLHLSEFNDKNFCNSSSRPLEQVVSSLLQLFLSFKTKQTKWFHRSIYHPPFPPFFFFWGTFLRAAPAAAGFCCLGGTALLVAVPVPEPGRGEVGGLLALLLASLKNRHQKYFWCCFWFFC